MSRPIVGTPAIEYRKGAQRFQRCSRCHSERHISPLVLSRVDDGWASLMVGPDLCAVLCPACIDPIEIAVQALMRERHPFPFVDENQQLLDNPRCSFGHALMYSHDGASMTCPICDNPIAASLLEVDTH